VRHVLMGRALEVEAADSGGAELARQRPERAWFVAQLDNIFSLVCQPRSSKTFVWKTLVPIFIKHGQPTLLTASLTFLLLSRRLQFEAQERNLTNF